MTVKTGNGFNLTEFSFDIFEQGGSIRVMLDCFADNGKCVPFHVHREQRINKELTSSRELYHSILSSVITKMIRDVVEAETVIPEKCKCQEHEWFTRHPDDRQEYWRTRGGRIYPKAHTVKCPNNPQNQGE